MTPEEKEVFVYRNYLHPLNTLKDFEIQKGNPDVRGWSILGNDGIKFGKVHELIVDTQAQKVRYLDVDINKDIFKDETKEAFHILIPIGVAILNKEDKNVIVPQLNSTNLRSYPFYRREPVYVLKNYERSVQDFYSGVEDTDYRYDSDFYDHSHYSSDEFYESKHL